jgi:hypothetical protein
MVCNVCSAQVLFKNLGRADFQRTVSLAEKFGRPEIRLYVRLKIVQALLDPNMAEKEKQARNQLVADDEN